MPFFASPIVHLLSNVFLNSMLYHHGDTIYVLQKKMFLMKKQMFLH